MADFCKACSLEIFQHDFKELADLIDENKVKLGWRATALCEGCGMISVDHEGARWVSEEIEGKHQWVKDKRLTTNSSENMKSPSD